MDRPELLPFRRFRIGLDAVGSSTYACNVACCCELSGTVDVGSAKVACDIHRTIVGEEGVRQVAQVHTCASVSRNVIHGRRDKIHPQYRPILHADTVATIPGNVRNLVSHTAVTEDTYPISGIVADVRRDVGG